MIMNGTDDPLVPFDGGSVSLFGLFYRLWKVRSSRQSGQYFADLNHIAGTPERNETEVADGVRVEQVLWRNNSNVEVELVAIHGGGHGIPQPYRRGPRLLGPSAKEPNGPAVIWAFFERQRPSMDRRNLFCATTTYAPFSRRETHDLDKQQRENRRVALSITRDR